MRLSQGILLGLVLVPAWKIAGLFWQTGPPAVDSEAARQGRLLFTHQWTPHDSMAQGDGLGPVFNASSCAECHTQGGIGGGGSISKNVTVYGLTKPHPRGLPQSGVLHQKAVQVAFQETLNLVHPSLPREPSIPLATLASRSRRAASEVLVSQRNTPALFGDGLIDAIPDEAIIAHQRQHSTAARLVGLNGARDSQVKGRVARLRDGRIGRFGWKMEFASLREFVKAACANELGLSNPGRPQATPLGKPEYRPEGVDLTEAQCTLMTDFIRSLPQPMEVVHAQDVRGDGEPGVGKALFRSIGCADCHSESLGSVAGLYSDLLLHDMGSELESSGGTYVPNDTGPKIRNDQFEEGEQPSSTEWRTAPLWGVADSAPYLHDGRATTLEEAIEIHGGEAAGVAGRFKSLSPAQQRAIVVFLLTLRAPALDPIPAAADQVAVR
jgi:CxxC motif-containing protein (DUF1111 family)